MTKRRLLLALALLVVLAGVALARPGGGESFSGGGGHGGSGGGGGAIFELIYWTLRLCIYYPAIGLPVFGAIVGYVAFSAFRQHQNRDWDSGPPVALTRAKTTDDLRALDPDFSQVVFEDFAFRLFSTAHRARSTPAGLASIAPYVTPTAQRALSQREPTGEAVQQVIVGALRVVRVDVPPQAADAQGHPLRARLAVEFEANVATARHTYYSVETWLFGRDATRTSKPPGAHKDFPCPNCGAPWQAAQTGTQVCASCGQAVDNGRFDWAVEQITLASLDERAPTLTTEVAEHGTELPTYRAPDADARWQQLVADDPAVTDDALDARLAMIYGGLNEAWSHNELAPIRGLVSDGLFDYLTYWVDAYKRQGLRNELVDMRITSSELAKVSRDRFYDAVTLRIFGTGKDYVVRGDEVVRGSKHRERAYSEYWTLIRTHARKGAPKADATCGNCGAPLKVSMAGACEFCGAHVTSGEFDWVVSKIEQDDTYRG